MADLTYYKAQFRQMLEDNPAIDPIHYFREKYGIQPLRRAKPPAFLSAPGDPNDPTQYEFGLRDVEPYLQGQEDAVKRALVDHYSLFERYYFPQMLNAEAYKQPGERRKEFPGGWQLVDGVGNTDRMAAYVNPNLGKNYIAFRGTRVTSPSDLLSDTHLLAAGRAGEGGLLGGVDSEAEDLFDAYPGEKWDVTGHSLGASRANIIQSYYDDEIANAHLFNMGLSPVPLIGWGPYASDRSTHFHITQDPISATPIGDKMERIHSSMKGGFSKAYVEEPSAMSVGSLLHVPKYHGLDAFKNEYVDKRITEQLKGEASRSHYLNQKQAQRLQLRADALPRDELLFAARRYVRSDMRDNLNNMDAAQLRAIVKQIAYIGRPVFRDTSVGKKMTDTQLKAMAYAQQQAEIAAQAPPADASPQQNEWGGGRGGDWGGAAGIPEEDAARLSERMATYKALEEEDGGGGPGAGDSLDALVERVSPSVSPERRVGGDSVLQPDRFADKPSPFRTGGRIDYKMSRGQIDFLNRVVGANIPRGAKPPYVLDKKQLRTLRQYFKTGAGAGTLEMTHRMFAPRDEWDSSLTAAYQNELYKTTGVLYVPPESASRASSATRNIVRGRVQEKPARPEDLGLKRYRGGKDA
jgi:hypothetical protein